MLRVPGGVLNILTFWISDHPRMPHPIFNYLTCLDATPLSIHRSITSTSAGRISSIPSSCAVDVRSVGAGMQCRWKPWNSMLVIAGLLKIICEQVGGTRISTREACQDKKIVLRAGRWVETGGHTAVWEVLSYMNLANFDLAYAPPQSFIGCRCTDEEDNKFLKTKQNTLGRGVRSSSIQFERKSGTQYGYHAAVMLLPRFLCRVQHTHPGFQARTEVTGIFPTCTFGVDNKSVQITSYESLTSIVQNTGRRLLSHVDVSLLVDEHPERFATNTNATCDTRYIYL